MNYQNLRQEQAVLFLRLTGIAGRMSEQGDLDAK